MAEVEESQEAQVDDLEARLKALEAAEASIDRAYSTGKAERAKITQLAQLDAAEAVAMAGIAMESDEAADEAMRISVIAERSGDREKAKTARKREREARKKAREDHKAATKSAKQAYDAIKFSSPNQMGFMRAVQVIFAIRIGVVLVWLMLTSRDHMQYNVTSMMDWIMIILEGVAFWMFINRYKVARPFVIGMAAFGLLVPVVVGLATGHFNMMAIIGNEGFYLFLILYFIFSRRVKATLVNDFSKHAGDFEKEDFRIERHGWPFVRNLIMYFIIFSIVGHWMEMGMCQFIILGLVQGEYDPSNTMLWRDVLYPFPMEGAAVVIIALVLYPFYLWLKEKVRPRFLVYVISFLAGALLCTIIEFSMGLLVNADLQLWDYRDNFCNFMGQVCLQNTMAFGVVASIITWWVYPMLERMIARVPRDIMNIVFVVVAVFGAIVWSLYLITPVHELDVSRPRTAVEQADVEFLRLENAVDDQADASKELRTVISDAKSLSDAQKAALLEKVDALDKDVKGLEEAMAEAEADVLRVAQATDAAAASSSSASASASSASVSASSASAEASGSSASAAA